jgi:hypothetical protein
VFCSFLCTFSELLDLKNNKCNVFKMLIVLMYKSTQPRSKEASRSPQRPRPLKVSGEGLSKARVLTKQPQGVSRLLETGLQPGAPRPSQFSKCPRLGISVGFCSPGKHLEMSEDILCHLRDMHPEGGLLELGGQSTGTLPTSPAQSPQQRTV